MSSKSRPALLGMAALNEHKLSFWNAMLLATVPQEGSLAIVSEDVQHDRRLGAGNFVNPFAPQAAATMAMLLDA